MARLLTNNLVLEEGFEVEELQWVHPNYDVESLLRHPGVIPGPQAQRHDQIIVAIAAKTSNVPYEDNNNGEAAGPSAAGSSQQPSNTALTNGYHPHDSGAHAGSAMHQVNGGGITGVIIANPNLNAAAQIFARRTTAATQTSGAQAPDPSAPNPPQGPLGTVGAAAAWFGPGNRFNMRDFHLFPGASGQTAVLATINHVCETIVTLVDPEASQEETWINTRRANELRGLIFKTDHEFATEVLAEDSLGHRVAVATVESMGAADDVAFWRGWSNDEAEIQRLRELATKVARNISQLENHGVNVYIWPVETEANRPAYELLEREIN